MELWDGTKFILDTGLSSPYLFGYRLRGDNTDVHLSMAPEPGGYFLESSLNMELTKINLPTIKKKK